ncbi:MAG: amidohydrolase family protein [Candidatus Aminicenantes bacterium]|nr:amidohydrolase family protein [Candidatus Aminicenantes bacterium]
MAEKKGIGNIHTHQINEYCLPRCIKRQQAGLPVWFLKSGIPDLIGGRQGREFLNLMRLEKISDVAEKLKVHMDKAEDSQSGFKKIDYSVVLLLDFKFVSKKAIIEYDYIKIMKDTAEACAQYPFRFFPFFCYDPRRKNVYKLLKDAYESYGYVGIKIYPATGFDPRPHKDECMESINNNGGIKENLESLYKFASRNTLPIITHCGPGGSYKCSVDIKKKFKDIWRYTEPSNFLEIAYDYGLRICFAHMGGKTDHRLEKELATQWHNQIVNLIGLADSWSSKGRFFADQSYGISHVINKKKKLKEHIDRTRKYLEDKGIGKYILFGTDWPLGLYKFTEKKYINSYRDKNGLTQEQQEKYFSDNIARFLFGESKKIPQNYVDFTKEQCAIENRPFRIPEWVKEVNGEYFLR